MLTEGLVRRYGMVGSLRLLRDFGLTCLLMWGARLVRWPFYIRGRHAISIGLRFTSGVGLRMDAFPTKPGKVLIIGNNVQVNDYVHIAAIEQVSIGDDTLIASRVFISDHNHGGFDGCDQNDGAAVPPALRPLRSKPVRIGHRVWIGEQVCILPGVTIGDGAVIGAGSVVTRDVPAGCVVAGNPARILRRYDAASHRWDRT